MEIHLGRKDGLEFSAEKFADFFSLLLFDRAGNTYRHVPLAGQHWAVASRLGRETHFDFDRVLKDFIAARELGQTQGEADSVAVEMGDERQVARQGYAPA